jgi:alpha-L-fucosidase
MRTTVLQLLAVLIALSTTVLAGKGLALPTDTQPFVFPHPHRIRFDHRSMIVDGKPVFVHSGALHYFRCPRELWKDRLQKLKDAGLNSVETYLAWNLHELQEPANPDDFSRLREMDQISDFIQTARDLGLYVIIRPGPYICAEVDRGGVPGWLMKHRPEGVRPGHYLRGNAPEVLAWSRHWFTAAAKVVKPHLITNVPEGTTGVILWQLENEYDWNFAGLPSEVRADVLRALAHASIDNGIDVPLFTCETMDKAFREDPFLRSHVFNTTNKYPWYDMVPLTDAIEAVARYQPETFRGVTELQGGWFSEAGGTLSEDQGHNAAQITQLALTCIERGCTYINYYMFYGGSNFGYSASQRLTQSYDYNAPLREWGGMGDRYYAVKSVGEMLKQHGEKLIDSDAVELNVKGEHPDVSLYLRRASDGTQFLFARNLKQNESRSGTVKVGAKGAEMQELSYALEPFQAKVLLVPAGAKDLSAGEWLPKSVERPAQAQSPSPASVPVRTVSITREEPADRWRAINTGAPLHLADIFDQRYVHYRANFDLSASEVKSDLALLVRSRGGGQICARINGIEVATVDGRFPLKDAAREGRNTAEFLFENLGCPRFGPVVEETQGIIGINLVPMAISPRALEGWRMKLVAEGVASSAEVKPGFDDRDWPEVDLASPAAITPAGRSTVYRAALSISQEQLRAGVALTLGVIRDTGTVYVNGQAAGDANNWLHPWTFDITRHLHEGNNSIAVLVQNSNDNGGLSRGCMVEPAGRALERIEVSPGVVVEGNLAPDQSRRMLVHYTLDFELPGEAKSMTWKLHLQAEANAFITLNGHLLGRYWAIGPQRDVYLPECWLNVGPGKKNVVELQALPTTDAPVGQIIRAAEVQSYSQHMQQSQSPVRLDPEDSLDRVLAKAAEVRPTPRQIAWQRDEISAFIHFGMNTFTDREWGDGNEDPRLFNPAAFDARQWVRAAKSAGISRMILTAKHHDGFCLWPSKFTEHCVRNSPWKDGTGDVVGELVEACRAEGMHYGIYISPWDRHEQTYGDSPKYNQYFLNQLREVLTSYPGIDEVWFDGACAEGPNGKRQEYDWRAYWQLIRELAPDAVISVRGPDVRWCGNEAGHTRTSEWSVIPMPGDGQSWERSENTLSGFIRDIYGDDLGGRDVLMRSRKDRAVLAWYPSQVNTSIRPGWFYHKYEDDRVRSLSELLKIYYGSVGGNGQFLLNIPPDQRGLFHENDVARLQQLGEIIKSTFERDLASGAKSIAEVVGGQSVGDAAAVLDGNPDTFWTTSDSPAAASVTVELPAPVRANCLMLQEHIASGQRVETFEVDVYSDGKWRTAVNGTVIGYKRLVRFEDATVSKLRIRFTQFRSRPTLASLGLYFAPAVLSSPQILRDIQGTVTIEPPAGACARYTLDGTNPTADSPLYTAPLPLPTGGLLIARSFPLTPDRKTVETGEARTRVEFGPAKAKWKIIDCDSQDQDGYARNAIDDNPQTLWHTRFREGTDPMPHHIAVDLGESMTIFGFAYTPRQDQWDNGIVMQARFEVSRDGKSWSVVADKVDFDNIVNSRQQQVVKLPTSITARYFRMTALRTVHDNNVASAADVSVLVR